MGDRLRKEGMRHDGVYISFGGQRHLIPLAELTGGKAIYVYGQNEVVKDLIAGAPRHRPPAAFRRCTNVSVHDIDCNKPKIRYQHKGGEHELTCDYIAGCDGFHGICRPALAKSGRCGEVLRQDLSVRLARDPGRGSPSSERWSTPITSAASRCSVCAHPKITRLYFQVPPDEDIDNWSDEGIWEEMLKRMTTRDGWKPNVGPLLNKNVTAMRSFVAEPMQAGRLYLAGDAAHIVPPTGAKGLNLAAADVLLLAARWPASTAPARGPARSLLRHRLDPRLEGAALLLVDDADAAPLPGRESHSTISASWPT